MSVAFNKIQDSIKIDLLLDIYFTKGMGVWLLILWICFNMFQYVLYKMGWFFIVGDTKNAWVSASHGTLWLVPSVFVLHYLYPWKLICLTSDLLTTIFSERARDGKPIHMGAVGQFLVLCLVLSCVSCTYALWFLHGRDVQPFMWCECYCYQFYRKIDNGLLEIDFTCLASDLLTTNILLKPLHVAFLRLHDVFYN